MRRVALVARDVKNPASGYRTVSPQQTNTFIIGIRRAAGKKNDGMPSNPEVRIIARTLPMLFAGILPSFVIWDAIYVVSYGDLTTAYLATFAFAVWWAYSVAVSFGEALDKISQDIQK